MMVVGWDLALVVTVLFFATFIRSAFGFGEAIIAVPLLALVLPVEVVVPVAVLVSLTVGGVVVAQDWRHVHFRSAGWLFLATAAGMPLGVWLLVSVPGDAIKGILAVVIIAFSMYSLISRTQPMLRDDRLAGFFGFGAGVLGGAYGMNGPPLVIYGALRGWSPQHFRATLQGYFVPASMVALFGYWLVGLWTPAVTYYYLISLPAILLAIPLGRAANRRMSGRAFLVYVHIGLIVAGGMLLLQSLT